FDLSWNITSVDSEGSAKMVRKVERYRFTLNAAENSMQFDSADGKIPEGQLGKASAPLFKAVSKLEISLTMDPRGGIKDIKIPEALLKQIKATKDAQIRQLFSPEIIRQLPNQWSMALPKEPVKRGQSWSQRLESKTAIGKNF